MHKKNLTLTLLFLIAILTIGIYAIVGGNNGRDILGVWILEEGDGKSGFQCGKNGIAASIYNTRCQYTNWSMHKNKLILKGERFEDDNIVDFADTMRVVKLNCKILVVEKEGRNIRYNKSR